jgi:DNA replication protein DnaC
MQTQLQENMETSKSRTCITCNHVFTFDPADYTWFRPEPDGTYRTFFPDTCDQCQEQAKRDAQMAEKAAAREKQWQDTTPPLFRTSDESRFPDMLVKAITRHDITGPIGLGIIGTAGTCKTRAAFQLLRRYLDAGRRIYATTGPDLAAAGAEQFREKPKRGEFDLPAPKDTGAAARRTLATCRTVDVLLIDDIEKAGVAKGELSPRAQLELFTILDARMSHYLPTVWTSNADGQELASIFNANMSDPIMRRLEEFSTIISTGGRP